MGDLDCKIAHTFYWCINSKLPPTPRMVLKKRQPPEGVGPLPDTPPLSISGDWLGSKLPATSRGEAPIV
ncbi:MAG: hypothetical protein PHY29_00800 [Syntrophales bacterium]|nr:hypothetical protein [Syntrophales bacterium]